MPCGWEGGFEFRRMRVDSRAPAATTLPRIGFAEFVGHPVDVVDTLRPAVAVHNQIADNGIADQREFSRARRSRQCYRRTVEIGSGVTAALALIAIVAGRPAAVLCGEIGDPVGNHAPSELLSDYLLG